MRPVRPQEPVAADSFEVDFDGRRLVAHAGQSVGSVLAGAGIVSWRTTRVRHRPRGLFCGIGICFDCLITVDGVPNQRACLVPVRPGMRLTSSGPVHRSDSGDDGDG